VKGGHVDLELPVIEPPDQFRHLAFSATRFEAGHKNGDRNASPHAQRFSK
jgi:hypothetical protein